MKRALNGKVALAGILAVGVGATAWAGMPEWADNGEKLAKCAGIAKAGKNDCGANAHDCSGKAKKDQDPEEWVYVPQGVCEKIVGGTVKATETAKK